MDLHNAHVNESLLACTHSSVAPKFAHDLPCCDIPQHHRLVPATRTEMAVVKGAGGRGKRRSMSNHDPSLRAPDSSLARGSPGRIQHFVAVATVRPQQRPTQRVPQIQGFIAAARQAVVAVHWGTVGRGYGAARLGWRVAWEEGEGAYH